MVLGLLLENDNEYAVGDIVEYEEKEWVVRGSNPVRRGLGNPYLLSRNSGERGKEITVAWERSLELLNGEEDYDRKDT